MAIEHEPGCDRQHTPRQRCNQNAPFAEQGEVPAEMAEERPTVAAISAVSERPTPVPEAVEEIVAIREELAAPRPPPGRVEPEAPRPEEAQESGGYGVLIGVAVVFATVATVLVMLLRRRGGDD